MNNLDRIGENKLSNTIAQPFNKESIREVRVVFTQNRFNQEWYAYGVVEFQNKNTKGEQRFDGKHFDEVVAQIKSFLTHEL